VNGTGPESCTFIGFGIYSKVNRIRLEELVVAQHVKKFLALLGV
jgi:hypothetical protein